MYFICFICTSENHELNAFKIIEYLPAANIHYYNIITIILPTTYIYTEKYINS